MIGKVVVEVLQCQFDTLSVLDFKAGADQAQLRDSKLTFGGLFKHTRVKATSQLRWTTLHIMEKIMFIQLDTPVGITFGRPKGSPWYHDLVAFRALVDPE